MDYITNMVLVFLAVFCVFSKLPLYKHRIHYIDKNSIAVISQVPTEDLDSGDNSKISFKIVSVSTPNSNFYPQGFNLNEGVFELNESTGDIRNKIVLNRDLADQYDILIRKLTSSFSKKSMCA